MERTGNLINMFLYCKNSLKCIYRQGQGYGLATWAFWEATNMNFIFESEKKPNGNNLQYRSALVMKKIMMIKLAETNVLVQTNLTVTR